MKTRVRPALAKTVATLPPFSLCYRRDQHQRRRGKLDMILSMQHADRPVLCGHDTLLKEEALLRYVHARHENIPSIFICTYAYLYLLNHVLNIYIYI